MPVAPHILHPDRELFTTASQFDIICHGQEEDRVRLWKEDVGLIARIDLSDSLPVQLGQHNGEFIIDWRERMGRHEITERQRFIKHPTLPFAATLDGYRAHDDAVVEAKMVNPYADPRDVVIQYTPQVLIQMQCRQSARGVLAVLRGFTLEEYEINVDASYVREVIERGLAFHRCVETMTPPHALPEKRLVPPELWRTVDLASSTALPNWGSPMIAALRIWSQTRDAVKQHDASKIEVKAMLPDDVGTVLFGDVSVRRSKNGSVTIREREIAL